MEELERRRRIAEQEEAETLALLMKKDAMENKMRCVHLTLQSARMLTWSCSELEKQMFDKKREKEEEEIRAQEQKLARLAEQLKELENTPTSPPPTLKKLPIPRVRYLIFFYFIYRAALLPVCSLSVR